ncbi:MAG: hypothetical protein E7559_00995 [Ruminococcaceae bacterium]|nr:hypothetical protein [Oscillospiraceae bacterium]
MSNKRLLLIAVLLAAVISAAMLFTACGGEDAIDSVSPTSVSGADVSGADVSAADVQDWRELIKTEDEMAIADLLVSNCDAFNAEDIEGYMAAVYPESKAYASTKEDAEMVFEKYNLVTVIDHLTIDSIKGDTAQVTVRQTMRRREGDEEGKSFTASESTLAHTVQLIDGRWFITGTVVEKRRELTDKWARFEQFVADPGIYVVPSASDVAEEHPDEAA